MLALSVCFLQPLNARALAASLLRQVYVCITTDEFFRFHKKEIDEMLCKLDSTEHPCFLKKYPTHLMTKK
jgi:hypothetical protein